MSNTAIDVDDNVDYADPDLTDVHARLASLRAEKAVVRVRFGSTTRFMLLRYRDVESAFRDEGTFSKSEAMRRATFAFMGPHLVGYDGHQHTVARALVAPTFKRSAVPLYVGPILGPTAEQLVDEIAPLGEADLMSTFAKKYPLRVITRLLGIPRDDDDKMAAWVKAMFNILGDPEGARGANAEFTEYVAPLIDERRARPGDDLLSAIVNEEVDGQRLGEEEIFGFLRLLFPAGVDTTWLTLGNVMGAVLQHPAVHQPLLEDEDERMWAIDETLRWEPTIGADEHVTLTDVIVAGVEIPAGEAVLLGIASANRDPDVFPEPDRWDLARRPTNHLSFGLGRHYCLGAHLARGEIQVAIEVLLRRLPNLRLSNEPRVFGAGLRGPRTLRVTWDAP